jgi:hypothetical protein
MMEKFIVSFLDANLLKTFNGCLFPFILLANGSELRRYCLDACCDWFGHDHDTSFGFL